MPAQDRQPELLNEPNPLLALDQRLTALNAHRDSREAAELPVVVNTDRARRSVLHAQREPRAAAGARRQATIAAADVSAHGEIQQGRR